MCIRDRDTVNWNTGLSITPLLRKLCALKKEEIFGTGIFEMEADDAADLVSIRWSLGSQTIAGVFSPVSYTHLAALRLQKASGLCL